MQTRKWKENAENQIKEENRQYLHKLKYRDMAEIENHAIYGHKFQAEQMVDPNCKDFSDVTEKSNLRIIN